jgi:site-specific recombinase XerD
MAKLTNDLLKNTVPETGKRLELRDDQEPGLIFRVTENGVRSWSIRYRNVGGEQRRKALGAYPSVSLAKAREMARKVKGTVAGGSDIVATERLTKAAEVRKRLNTIEGLAEAYFVDAELGTHRFNSKPKRPGTIAEEKRIYNKLVKPKFGKSAVADITRAEIQAFVSKQAKSAVSNGRHCRNIIRQLMSYAVRNSMIEVNPAHDIAVVMPEARERVLTDKELRTFWRACEKPHEVEDLALSLEMGIALRMAAVTLQRGGEVVGMKWCEIDRAAKVWLIPAARMKGKKAHLVPLSDMALDLLDEAREEMEGNGSEYVFPSPRSAKDVDTHLDRRAFTRAMKRIITAVKIERATPHDLRRTGATNLTSERVGIPRFVVSQVLAHAGDTGGSAEVTGKHYDMNDYLPEKRRALDAWAKLLEAILTEQEREDNVRSLHG